MNDNDGSDAPPPSGAYSTGSGYVSPSGTNSVDIAAPPADAVQVFVRKGDITVTYNAREVATQRMIRRINGS